MLQSIFRTLHENVFTNKNHSMHGQEELIKYCRAEYGKEWRYHYAEISDHQNKDIGRVIK